jgi:hypothetical protein
MSLITKDYRKIATLIDWREWSSQYWSAVFVTGSVYRKIIAPRCRQCRNLPGHMRWTGERLCSCGNPYINLSGAHRLPLKTRLAAGIKPWDKPLTRRQKAQIV